VKLKCAETLLLLLWLLLVTLGVKNLGDLGKILENGKSGHYSGQSSRMKESWSNTLLNRFTRMDTHWNKKRLPLVARLLCQIARLVLWLLLLRSLWTVDYLYLYVADACLDNVIRCTVVAEAIVTQLSDECRVDNDRTTRHSCYRLRNQLTVRTSCRPSCLYLVVWHLVEYRAATIHRELTDN